MTSGHVTNNLPSMLSTFIGRESEIATVLQLLDGSQLVTLTGAGGCGKTRLALEVARRLTDSDCDGVWWVDLGPVADTELVASACAAALAIRVLPGEATTDTIARRLAPHSVLVVLDNCEHVVATVATLAHRLVQSCPRLHLLATSREPLSIDGEVTWRVPSLTIAANRSTDALLVSEAGQLFVDRAVRVRPNFRLTGDIAEPVAVICERLDGIPLAIELAAARVRVLTAEQIVDGLHDRFRLLTGGARNALPRQRTLEASVDWSHELLTADERVAFRRLAAFAGAFTLDGAEAVCSGEGIERPAVLDLLTNLVDRSLLLVDDGGPSARYRLLETIRDYASSKLVDAGEAEAVFDRHLDHYSNVAASAAHQLIGPDAGRWVTVLEGDLDDLRRAMDWSQRAVDSDRGLAIAADLVWFWRARNPGEGRSRLEAALDPTDGDPPLRSRALVALAATAMMSGDVPAAVQRAHEALAIGRQLGDDRIVGQALSFLGWLTILGDADAPAAIGVLEEAVVATRAADDRPHEALALNALGFAHHGTSSCSAARPRIEEGIRLGRSIGFDRPVMEGGLWLGLIELTEGRFDQAAAHLEAAVTIDDWHWDPFFQAVGRSMLGEVLVAQGRFAEAHRQFDIGLTTAVDHRDAFGEAEVRRGLAWLHYVEGATSDAAEQVRLALDPLLAMDRREAARTLAISAHVELAVAGADAARSRVANALGLAASIDSVRALSLAIEADALQCRLDRKPDAAEDRFHELLTLSQGRGHLPGVCDALDGLASTVADTDRFEESARLHGAADALRRSLGYARFPVRHEQYEADVERPRSALGDHPFESAWDAGADLTLADAVAYARRRRGERKRPPHGWRSLTPTEQRVVALVARGLTNPQIGESLFVSPRTVQSHLRHIFNKLDVSTRAELAARVTAQLNQLTS